MRYLGSIVVCGYVLVIFGIRSFHQRNALVASQRMAQCSGSHQLLQHTCIIKLPERKKELSSCCLGGRRDV